MNLPRLRQIATPHLLLLVLVAAALAGVSCGQSAETATHEYLKRGNGHFDQQQYEEAIVEYRNAVKADPKLGEARYKLASAYLKVGDPKSAYGEAVRAADLLPDDAQAQIQAVTLQLRAGRFEDAKTRAEAAATRHPDNAVVQILLGNAFARLKDLDQAMSEVQDAISLDPASGDAYTALAFVSAAQGRGEEAETAFRKAAEVAPQSIDVHLARANYFWTRGKTAEAEAALERAYELDNDNVGVSQTLATFFIANKRPAEAEPYLRKLAELVQDPSSRLVLADLYMASGRSSDAMAVLDVAAGNPQAFASAKSRIAWIHYASGRRTEANATIDEALEKEPHDGGLLVLRSRILLREDKLDEALTSAQSALQWNPQLVSAHYAMGQILSRQRNVAGAQAAFEEVLKLTPRSVPAQMALARLHLEESRPDETAQLARQALASQPENPGPRLMLAKALIAQRDFQQAGSELSSLLKQYPRSADVHATAGALAFARQDLRSARRSYQEALTLAPDLDDAFRGIVVMDLAEGRAAQARASVASRLKERPGDPQLWLLDARVALAGRDIGRAEQSLQKAIAVDASSFEAYSMLASLYVGQRKLDAARGELERLVSRQPNAIGPHTLIAMILEIQSRPAEARKLYERVLEIDPDAAVAANNLAWMYTKEDTNLDTALKLARVASAALPDTPEVNDTLGSIYYKMRLTSQAIPRFEQSVASAPDVADFRYHLGLAYLKQGDWDRARQELAQALSLNPKFDGAEHARTTLQGLGQ